MVRVRSVGSRVWLGLVLSSLTPPATAQAPGAPLIDAVRETPDVVLSWTALVDATSYRVERSLDPGQPWMLLAQGPATTFRDVGVVPGPPANPSPYYYRVIAENSFGAGPPSNLAFKLNIPLTFTGISAPSNNPNPVSLPYRFFPAGLGSWPPGGTGFDMCNYIGGWTVVWTFSRTTVPQCYPQIMNCEGTKNVFNLTPAEAYTFHPNLASVTLDLVGAHDPEFEPGGSRSVPLRTCQPGPSSCPLPYWPVSIPYHAAARTASDLCAELVAQSQPVFAVRDYRFELAVDRLHYCGTPIGDFDLVPGRAYDVQMTADGSWQPVVR